MVHAEDMYIDLGTVNTLIYSRRRGLLLNEPSFLARRSDGRFVAAGHEAKRMLGRTPASLHVLRPLREGVIADYGSTSIMLKAFVESLRHQIGFLRPRLLISLPCRVTDFEKESVREVGRELGAREVHLADEPMLAAVGSGLPVMQSRGRMIVDIGGGTSEIAVISCGGIVHAEAVRIGGDDLDTRILEHLRLNRNLSVGEPTAEWLKVWLASALPEESRPAVEIAGYDLVSGWPRRISLETSDLSRAVEEHLRPVLAMIRYALENVPPEIAGDLAETGLVLAGGGSLLHGLDRRIERETGLKVSQAPEPLLAIARGGSALLQDEELRDHLKL